MLTIDEAYDRILALIKKRATKGELDFTFSDLQKSFPDLDASEIFAKVHLLKDAWVINEVSPNCFTINSVLLHPLETSTNTRKTRKKPNRQVAKSKRGN
jgi:hypothetical protein